MGRRRRKRRAALAQGRKTKLKTKDTGLGTVLLRRTCRGLAGKRQGGGSGGGHTSVLAPLRRWQLAQLSDSRLLVTTELGFSQGLIRR